MRHPLVHVEVVEDRAGGEGPQDQLEAELLGERDHPDQQHEGTADADLGAGVLEADERVEIRRRSLRFGDARRDRRDHEHEERRSGSASRRSPSTRRRTAGSAARTEAKSAIDAAAMTSWPKRDETSPESCSTGTITPSEVEARMIAISSGSSAIPARSRTKPAASASASESAKPSEAARKSAPAQRREIDLEPGEEEQEREPDQSQDLDRLVDLDPAEQRRPDHDPDHDLQHHRRQPQPRHQPERQRGGEARRDDDQQVLERDLLHAAFVVGGGFPLRGRSVGREGVDDAALVLADLLRGEEVGRRA